MALQIATVLAAIVLAFFITRYTSVQFTSSKTVQTQTFKETVLAMPPLVIVVALMVMVPIPISFFYLLLWLASIVTGLLCRKDSPWSWLVTNLVATFLIIPHAIVMSATAVATSMTLWEVLDDPLLRCVSIVAMLISSLLIGSTANKELSLIDTFDSPFGRSLRPLALFSWFSIAYLAFDALSNDFRPESNILAMFTLLSTILLGIGLISFLVSATHLGHDAYLEEEYLRLTKESEAEATITNDLRRKAYTDALTGLSSRRTALETLQNLLDDNKRFFIVFIDMNDLKTINDSQGHLQGDACLMRLADALRASFGIDASLCRMGGDEFLAILETDDDQLADTCARRALELLGKPLDGLPSLSFCYGVLDSNGHDGSPSELIQLSDTIMYGYKQAYHGRTESGNGPDRPTHREEPSHV